MRWAGVAVLEISKLDAAFAGNQLLSTLSPEVRALLEPHGTIVELKAGEIALTRGDQVSTSLFPIGPTLLTMEVEISSGRTV